MSTSIDNLVFNLPHDEGESIQIKYNNDYGCHLTKINDTYTLYIIKKIDDFTWTSIMDDNMKNIYPENGIKDLTKAEAEDYLNKIEGLN